MKDLLAQVAISGIGHTDYSRDSKRSVLQLAGEAARKAIEDAGLRAADIDAVLCYHLNDSPLSRDVAAALGIPALNWWNDSYAGGSHTCRIIGEAAMVVGSGVARHVLCYRALNGCSGQRMGQLNVGETAGVHQFMTPHGFGTPVQIFAMAARRHMHEYGTTKCQMGAVALAMRANASSNPRAMRREPLTMDEYLASRPVAEPFSVLDCCQETDGACAIVVSRAESVPTERRVRISGLVHGANAGGRFPFDRCDSLSESAFARLGEMLYRQAGLSPAEIDAAQLYDAFTFEVIMQLEDFGFCKRGEGGAFVEAGRIALSGELPVNTHGGLHSEGYVQGLNSVLEAVLQVRGEAGACQIREARHVLVTGFGFSAGGAMIVSRG